MAKIGENHVAKMAKLGLAELQNVLYPSSNIGIAPVVSATSLEQTTGESSLKGEYDKLLQQAQERPPQEQGKEIER